MRWNKRKSCVGQQLEGPVSERRGTARQREQEREPCITGQKGRKKLRVATCKNAP